MAAVVVAAASAHVAQVLDLLLSVVVSVEGSEASLTLLLEAIPCPEDSADMIVSDDDRGAMNVLHRDGGVRTMGRGDDVVVDQFR